MLYIGGTNAGKLLTINEVKNIGLFFKGGAYYNRLNPDGTIKKGNDNGN